MLRIDPKQRLRIVEIIANLSERIREAELNGWLGGGRLNQPGRSGEETDGFDRSNAIGQLASGRVTDLGLPIRSAQC
jgi:hypothetical protein